VISDKSECRIDDDVKFYVKCGYRIVRPSLFSLLLALLLNKGTNRVRRGRILPVTYFRMGARDSARAGNTAIELRRAEDRGCR
jgi:hypothetical protein